jgi:DNA modification methylase
MQKLGMADVPVIEAGHLSDTQRRAYIIADNKLAMNAGWDDEMLRVELDALGVDGFDLELTGFSLDEIADLQIEEVPEGLTDEDAVPDAPEDPVTVEGDVWVLGNHRLHCGDSTSIDAVEKLMDGQKADMVFTDPPYGINEKGDRSGRNTGLAKNHNFADFKDDTTQYAIDAYNLCEGLKIPRQVWWGANYYCHALPQSNNWFIWDKRVEKKMHDTQSDCEMAWVKSEFSSVRIFRHLWKGFNKDSERGEARVHPTQKPVELAIWAFDYFKNVVSVLDFFGGSGSALIACEKTNRKCYMMELSPVYCDVIINRWQQYTGKEAVLESTGETYNSKMTV